MQQLFTNSIGILILDEFSCNTLQNLCHIDQRLKEIYSTGYFTCTKPFGGLCVILLGDCFQQPAAKEFPIYKHMVMHFVTNVDGYSVEQPVSIGCHLFKKNYYCKLLSASKSIRWSTTF